MMKKIPLFLVLGLFGCSNEPSHLPSPLELPGAVVGTLVENATYGARRKRVKAYVSENYAVLREQAKMGQGAVLERALSLAGVTGDQRAKAKQELQVEYARYFPGSANPDVEPVVVVLMVHG